MKPIITLFFVAFGISSSAQSPYRPFPESDAGWVEEHSWLDGSDAWTTCQRTVRFASDTVIEGVTYHQLRSVGDCVWQNVQQGGQSGVSVEPDAVFARFRQDVDARKVFAYDVYLQQEVLWFDFTLGLGAYPETYQNAFPVEGIEVVALDSVELNDGYHRTWVLATVYNGNMLDSAYCTIIEGVGSTYGLDPVYGLAPPFEWGDALTCHSANGEGIYPLGGPACDLSMSVPTRTPTNVELVAYPNPACASVRIQGTWPTGARYVLVNALGMEVRAGKLRNSIVDLTGLGAGVYMLGMQDVAGSGLGAVRFMKE